MANFYLLSTFDQYAHDAGRQLVAAAVLDDQFIIQMAKALLRQQQLTLVSYAFNAGLIAAEYEIEPGIVFDLQIATHYLAHCMQVFLMYPAGEEPQFLEQATRFGIRSEALEVARVPLSS